MGASAAVVLLSACGGGGSDDGTTGPRDAVVGRYALASVNGASLPCACPYLAAGGVAADTLVLHQGGSYGETVYVPAGSGSPASSRLTIGDWQRTGAAVYFDRDAGTPAAVRSDGSLYRVLAPRVQFGDSLRMLYVRAGS